MKKTLNKRYRLNFYSHNGKVLVQTDSSDWNTLEVVYNALGQYYSKSALFVKNDSTDGKWVERFDIIKFVYHID